MKKQAFIKLFRNFFIIHNTKKSLICYGVDGNFEYRPLDKLDFLRCFILSLLMVGIFLLGCSSKKEEVKDLATKQGQSSATALEPMEDNQPPTVFAPPVEEASEQPQVLPETILTEMVNIYAKSKIYGDKGYIEAVYLKKDPDPQNVVLSNAGRPNKTDGPNKEGQNSKTYKVTWPCSIVFKKPARIRMKVNDGLIYSDGAKVYGLINHKNAYTNLYLERTAPILISSIKELYPDARLASALQLRVPSNFFWVPPQLVLLLSKDPLKTFVPPSASLRLLEPAYADINHQKKGSKEAELCDRIAILADDGQRVLWISRLNKTLVRIELPIEQIAVSEEVDRLVRLTFEFKDRQISTNPNDFPMTDSDFSPEHDLLPGLFGTYQKVDNFPPVQLFFLKNQFPPMKARSLISGFSDIDFGELSDKCRVCFFWHCNNYLTAEQELADKIASQSKLKRRISEKIQTQNREFLWEIEQLMKRTESNPKIECIAICVENSKDFSDEDIRTIYGNMASSIPLYRLEKTEVENTFLKRMDYPSIIVLDTGGTIQKYSRAMTPFASHIQLMSQLKNILGGHNIYEEEYLQYDTDLRRFAINMGGSDFNDIYRTTTDPAIQEGASDWLPRRFPEKFKLTKSWELNTLPDSSNPFPLSRQTHLNGVQEESNRDLVIVPCDGNKLAVVTAQGKLIKKVAPNVPGAEEPVTFVRTAVLANGKRYFVASALLETKKLHRYDGNFNYQGVIDLSRTREQWVGDVRLVDANKDGDPDLLVSLIGDDKRAQVPVHGVYAVDEKTKNIIWKDESIKTPYRIGIHTNADGERFVLALNQPESLKGNIVVNDLSTGKRRTEIVSGQNMSIIWFGYGQSLDGKMESSVVFLEQIDPYKIFLAGLSPENGKILWQTPLLQHNRGRQVECVTYGDINGDGKGEWLIPLQDGSILFYDGQGTYIDRFNYGKEVTGLCVAQWENGRFLIVADPKGITAWRIE